jgi:DNA-binding transcriptional LysR family regulator
MINLNRLEVFYYVVRHGGIVPASRHIPWGISASAISKNVTSFEESERVTLFVRGDAGAFELTAAGQRYYDAFAPMYEQLQRVSAETAGLTGKVLRIGASPYVQKQYVMPLLGVLRRRHPDIPLEFRVGTRVALEDYLRRDEIDVAVLTVDEPPTDRPWQPLLQRSLVLYVPADNTATEGWACLEQGARLAAPPATEAVARRFFSALRQRNGDWPVAIRASETAEVVAHVQTGDCVGPGVGVGALLSLPGIRALPLAGAEPVFIGAAWRDESHALRTLLQLAVNAAQAVIDVSPKENAVCSTVDTGESGYVAVASRKTQ